MTAIFIQLTRDLYVIRLKHFSASLLFEIHDTRQPQPTLRKTKRPAEEERRATGDEPQGTMGRVQTAGEARLARCLLPAFLCARERDVWIQGSDNLVPGIFP